MNAYELLGIIASVVLFIIGAYYAITIAYKMDWKLKRIGLYTSKDILSVIGLRWIKNEKSIRIFQ